MIKVLSEEENDKNNRKSLYLKLKKEFENEV